MVDLLDVLHCGRQESTLGQFAQAVRKKCEGIATLESRTEELDDLFSWAIFRQAVAVAPHVCQVVIRGINAGTGVLVGPDLVLTNAHVVASLMGDAATLQANADYLILKFDFMEELQPNGSVIIPAGETRGVPKEGWLIACSPPHPDELAARPRVPPDTVLPFPECDYALLRLQDRIGEEHIPDGTLRGWTGVANDGHFFEPLQRIFLAQHAAGQPLMGSIGRISATPRHGCRIRYTAGTRKGSSGSPCWNNDFKLVALHNLGGHPGPHGPENQGIPIGKIVAHLQAGGPQLPPPPQPRSSSVRLQSRRILRLACGPLATNIPS